MKKIISIFLLLLLLYPFRTQAVSIQNTAILGKDTATVGEEFSLSFHINFSGLQRDLTDSFGIATVTFELIFDDSVFEITSVSVNDWITDITQENGSTYIVSVVKEEASPYKCIDGILYCSDYSVTIRFLVNDTNKTSSTIEMGDILVGLLNVDYSEGLSDATVFLEGTSNQKKNITIQRKEQSNPTQPNPVSKPPKVDTPTKSDNNYLKSLQIENHNIKFLKTKNEYNISVDKEENQLIIHVEVDDDKATYQVFGADNLADNNYQVSIEVTAENGTKNTYILNVDVREKSGVVYERPKEKNEPPFVWKNSYTIIGIVAIIFIILVVVVIRIKDKKIDNELDQL